MDPRDEKTGVYVHIPWCASKCWYCDFNSHAKDGPPEAAYVDALIREWRSRRAEVAGSIASIYFGGGTPSLFSPPSIAAVIDAIRRESDVASDVEITLEANPGTVESSRIAGFVDAGVNRISLGVQSLDQDVLAKLGRRHSPDDVIRAVEAVRATGLANFSLDLMFGIPERPEGRLTRDIDEVLALGPPHVSAYCLTIYEDTRFGRERRQGKREDMEEDGAADEFEDVWRQLEVAGRHQYEIANFCQPGFESRHNTNYWKRGRYIGLGAGAHSFLPTAHDATNGLRFENEKSPEEYMRKILDDGSARVWDERLSADQALGEAMFLGLRQIDGVDLGEIAALIGIDPRVRFATQFDELIARGWIARNGENVRLTREGLFVSDEVFCRFV